MNPEKILDIAKAAVSTEIQELENLKNRLDQQFLKAVEIINSATGKLIVVGIGKSAHVGNKIVATLNSTGTPAQFLHASEAIHGDLGVIQKSDVVLCISNSGNSPEIVNLLPPGYYDRQSLCDQLNSALAAHGWGAVYGTVE